MKTKIAEPDFIGGLGALTAKEEEMLAAFFSKKKSKLGKRKAKRKHLDTDKQELSKSGS